MNALAACWAAARARARALTPRRTLAPASDRRLFPAPVLAASKRKAKRKAKKNAALPSAAAPPKVSAAAQRRALEVAVQDLLSQVRSRDEAASQLLAQVAALQSRVEALEQRLPKEPQQVAERPAEQTVAERNRARRRNASCEEFWLLRGGRQRPWQWEDVFQHTDLATAEPLARVIEVMRSTPFDEIDFSEWDVHPVRCKKALINLRSIYDRGTALSE